MADMIENTADWFEGMATTYDKLARSRAYRRNLPARAAIMREAAHYLEVASRLRGRPIMPLKVSRSMSGRR